MGEIQRQRAETYARCSVEVEADHTTAGCEAIFDQALTNGLAAIVAHRWPGKEKNAKGFMLPASKLLDLIEANTTAADDEPHVFVIPDPEPDKLSAAPASSPWPWMDDDEPLPPLDTRIDVATLREGLNSTQPVRHARGEGGLERKHVDALLALDDHEALRVLSAEHANRVWTSAHAEDAHSQARAVDLLVRIGEEEAARRAEQAVNLHEPYHPKYNPDGLDLQDCPVCGFETFSAIAGDDYGMQVGIGQCLVCHYDRSADVAEDQALSDLYRARWAND